MQGTRVRSDAQFGKIPNALGQLSLCTTSTEACVPRVCASQQEKPPQWEAHGPRAAMESSPCLLQLEKARAAAKTQGNQK